MGSDDLHKKRVRERKTRKEAVRDLTPYRILIVCEGEKTEPGYFKTLKDLLEVKFRDLVDLKKVNLKEFIEIDGSGKNTESLVRHTLRLKGQASIPFGHVWCVFDKDSFTNEQFNSAIINAEKEDIEVAWSNEAIELWFLLHFEYVSTGITRYQYIEKLNYIFKGLGLGKYEKNMDGIYNILKEYGSQDFAIGNAKKLLRDGFNYADMKPATTVFKLVELLENML
ncbi:RloB family protein [Cetobacterium somerae]